MNTKETELVRIILNELESILDKKDIIECLMDLRNILFTSESPTDVQYAEDIGDIMTVYQPNWRIR